MWPTTRDKIIISLIVILSAFLVFLLGVYFYAKEKVEEQIRLSFSPTPSVAPIPTIPTVTIPDYYIGTVRKVAYTPKFSLVLEHNNNIRQYQFLKNKTYLFFFNQDGEITDEAFLDETVGPKEALLLGKFVLIVPQSQITNINVYPDENSNYAKFYYIRN